MKTESSVSEKTKPATKEYLFAIRVYSTDLGFFQKKRNVDFLLDGQKITRKNTVFIAEDTITDKYHEEFKKRNYDLVEIKKIPLINILTPRLFLSLFTFNKTTILESYEKTVWEYILGTISFRHFICYNDTSLAHKFRNRVFSDHGILTWYYNHSSDYAYLYEKNDGVLPYQLYNADKEIYKNLVFDKMICWNEKQVEFFKKLGCEIGEYIITGSLWSQFIENTDSEQKTIGIFDTTVKEDLLPNTETDLSNFYKGIFQLKALYPDYEFKIKPKNIFGFYLKLYEICDCLKELNLLDISQKNDTSDVIEHAAMIICAPFTSIAIEAREAGIPAIYFDASDKWRGTYYDKEGFVAHNIEELKTMVQDCLTSGKHYKKNNGIEKFRDALLK